MDTVDDADQINAHTRSPRRDITTMMHGSDVAVTVADAPPPRGGVVPVMNRDVP
jgi:hypothetical protein